MVEVVLFRMVTAVLRGSFSDRKAISRILRLPRYCTLLSHTGATAPQRQDFLLFISIGASVATLAQHSGIRYFGNLRTAEIRINQEENKHAIRTPRDGR